MEIDMLLFKPHHESLPDNSGVIRNWLFNLNKKLDKHPELLTEYNNIIINYENEGIVERVESEFWRGWKNALLTP